MPDESLPADSLEEHLVPLPADSLEEHLVPLSSTDPDSDIDDLAPALADRTVVGLGEATHGSREFLQVKHRLLRWLVSEHDLRVVALEANLAESLAVDDFVVRGEGDPSGALLGLHLWPWQVESMLALVEWLRSFNAGRDPGDRVRFLGVDAQHTAGAVAALRDFLGRADEEYLSEVDDTLSAADDGGRSPGQRDGDDVDRRLGAIDRLVADLSDRLRDREVEYVATTDREAWERARRHVRTLSQTREYKARMHHDDLAAAMEARDRAMADNVAWLVEGWTDCRAADGADGGSWPVDHGASGRVVVLAHNAHVNRMERRSSGETAPSMGSHLADRYGDDYYALASEFGGGRFQAIAEANGGDGGEEYGLRKCVLTTALPGTVGRELAELEEPAFVVDFESARGDPAVARWLDAARDLHSVGAVFRRDDPESHVERYRLGEAFDGLCYVAETTRARPLDG